MTGTEHVWGTACGIIDCFFNNSVGTVLTTRGQGGLEQAVSHVMLGGYEATYLDTRNLSLSYTGSWSTMGGVNPRHLMPGADMSPVIETACLSHFFFMKHSRRNRFNLLVIYRGKEKAFRTYDSSVETKVDAIITVLTHVRAIVTHIETLPEGT